MGMALPGYGRRRDVNYTETVFGVACPILSAGFVPAPDESCTGSGMSGEVPQGGVDAASVV